MSEAPLERRMSAIMAIDISGYSRLMEEDETGTFVRAREKLANVIGPHVARGHGRLFKNTGDGALVEFPFATVAVNCAIAIQQENERLERDVPVERRMRLRVGISSAEVIVQDGDLFGGGVNLAARLEGAAEVGGIAVSEAIAQVAMESGAEFLELGLVALKNIARPMRIYKVSMEGEAGGTSRPPGRSLVRGFGDRPAIAVLPMQTQVGDQSSEYIADGFTEDLIGALSRWRSFPVISRNSVFAFKGKVFNLPFVAQQLGARFISEGTMRVQGPRIKTLLQLHDVETMDVLLSDEYVIDLNHAPASQDEIVRTILGAIEPELLRRERERVMQNPEQSTTAYDLLQRGLWHHYRYTAPDNLQARAYFRNALAIAPSYSQAAASLSLALSFAAQARWEDDVDRTRQEALASAQLAVQSDGRDPQSRFALGHALFHGQALAEAVQQLREAVRLDPSHAAAHANLAFCYNYQNRPQQALDEVTLALRLSPHDPRRFMWLPALAGAHYLSGDYRDALRVGQEALAANSSYLPVVRYIVASMGQLGALDAARTTIPLLFKLDRTLSKTESHLRDYFHPDAVSHLLAGLEKAGFT